MKWGLLLLGCWQISCTGGIRVERTVYEGADLDEARGVLVDGRKVVLQMWTVDDPVHLFVSKTDDEEIRDLLVILPGAAKGMRAVIDGRTVKAQYVEGVGSLHFGKDISGTVEILEKTERYALAAISVSIMLDTGHKRMIEGEYVFVCKRRQGQ